MIEVRTKSYKTFKEQYEYYKLTCDNVAWHYDQLTDEYCIYLKANIKL